MSSLPLVVLHHCCIVIIFTTSLSLSYCYPRSRGCAVITIVSVLKRAINHLEKVVRFPLFFPRSSSYHHHHHP